MADAPQITDLDIASWLRNARKQAAPQAWLEQLNEDATDAIAAGDVFVNVLSGEGTSSSQDRDVNARFLQHVTELCLQRLAAAEAAGGEENLPPTNAVRVGAFW